MREFAIYGIDFNIGFDGAEDEVEMQIQEIVVAAGPP